VDNGGMAGIARGAVVEFTAEIDDLHEGSLPGRTRMLAFFRPFCKAGGEEWRTISQRRPCERKGPIPRGLSV
jgi:hypothetical protein